MLGGQRRGVSPACRSFVRGKRELPRPSTAARPFAPFCQGKAAARHLHRLRNLSAYNASSKYTDFRNKGHPPRSSTSSCRRYCFTASSPTYAAHRANGASHLQHPLFALDRLPSLPFDPPLAAARQSIPDARDVRRRGPRDLRTTHSLPFGAVSRQRRCSCGEIDICRVHPWSTSR